MKLELKRAGEQDAQQIHSMQTKAFAGHLAVYQDYDTNPGAESLDCVRAKLMQAHTYFYYIVDSGLYVGAIRVVDRRDGSPKHISPIFILPEFQNHGYAQAAIREAERLHGENGWLIDTILQEKGNCYLYEKLGYHRTGRLTVINERLTLVDYEK